MSNVEATRESLSALLDGEANDLDIARVLKAVDDPGLRDDWCRQVRISEALRGQSRSPQIDVSAGVRAALEASPARQANPLVGLAVAASVTFAVVFGGQAMLSSQVPAPAAPVATVAGGLTPVQGGAALQASLDSNRTESTQQVRPAVNRVLMQPVSAQSDSRYDQLALERYQRLGAEHATASALLQPSVLVPYARVPESQR